MDQRLPAEKRREGEPPLVTRYGKTLPRRAQLSLLLLVTALIFLGFFSGPMIAHFLGFRAPVEQPAEAPAETVSGHGFKVTPRQWATLKVQSVEQRTFQDTVETDGRIALDDDLATPVFSPYSGRIIKLTARAGDRVAKGDPLFAIQATELAQAQNDLLTAAANLRTATAQLRLATTNETRQHALYLAKGAALKDWQQAQVDLATAQGGMNSASIAVAAVRNRLRILGKSDEEIGQIEATSDVLRLNADAVVNAPIGGTVVQRQAGLGENIVSAASGASAPVFMISDLSKVWLVANAREEDSPRLHLGDEVAVAVLAYPGREFRARLTYVAPAIDPNTHRLPVRAELENPEGLLKPDMFASFRITTGQERQAVAVAEVAVVHEADSAHVWLAHSEDKSLELRDVQPGRTRDGMVEIKKGLAQGDSIVTSGAVFIDRAATGD